MTLTSDGFAKGERISFVVLDATTRGNMVHDCAFSILPADSSAGVRALVVRAGFVIATVRVLHALWVASFVRVAAVLARASTGSVSAQGVGSAG